MSKFDEKLFYSAVFAVCPLLFVSASVQANLCLVCTAIFSILLCTTALSFRYNRYICMAVLCVLSVAVALCALLFVKNVLPKIYPEIERSIFVSAICSMVIVSCGIYEPKSKTWAVRRISSLVCFIILALFIFILFQFLSEGKIWNLKIFKGFSPFFASAGFGFVVLGLIVFLFNIVYIPRIRKREMFERLVLEYENEIKERSKKQGGEKK